MSHSSIRCGCVSARQIFSGGKGISRSTTTESVSVAGLLMGVHPFEVIFEVIEPARETGQMTRSSSALWCLPRADGASGSSHRIVQCHGGADERLQRLFIDLVALMEIDGTPGVAFEAGVEEA